MGKTRVGRRWWMTFFALSLAACSSRGDDAASTELASTARSDAGVATPSVKVFLLEQHGKPLPSNPPGMVTTRVAHRQTNGTLLWDAPSTASNQNDPPDFHDYLARVVELPSPGDQVAVGVYPPTGYRVLRYEMPNCTWESERRSNGRNGSAE